MKPFLILQLRPLDEASENEFQAFLRYGGLKETEVRRIRMEKNGIPDLRLNDYSAIICGGGPSNVSDPEEKKNPAQQRFEADLRRIYPEIMERDFPFLGACYGIGSLSKFKGGEVSKDNYSEEVGPSLISLTEEAESDPLTTGLPGQFNAFVGHKESCQNLPDGATLLARSEQCPIHMIRFGSNVYATQFHPELDNEGICLRIRIYQHHGYFDAEETESLIERMQDEEVTIPEIILKRFVDRYRG